MYNLVDTRINRCLDDGYARSRILDIHGKHNPSHSPSHYSLAGRAHANAPYHATSNKISIFNIYRPATSRTESSVLNSIPSAEEAIVLVTVLVIKLNCKEENTRIAEKNLWNDLFRTYSEYCQLLLMVLDYLASNRVATQLLPSDSTEFMQRQLIPIDRNAMTTTVRDLD